MARRRSIITYGITAVVSAVFGAVVFSQVSDDSAPSDRESAAADTAENPTASTSASTETSAASTGGSDESPPADTATVESAPAGVATEDTGASAEPAATSPVSEAAFAEGFTGNVGLERFRTGVFQRNVDVHDYDGGSGGTWEGDHPVGCSTPGDPYRTRPLRWNPDETMAERVATAFYNCNDHMMTSMGDVDGYSVVWFSPDQTFTDVTRVCWDVNLTNLGNRQWWEVAVVPIGEPELFADVDAADLDAQGDGTSVLTYNSPNSTQQLAFNGAEFAAPYNADTDKATRYEHCMVDNGDGTMTITQDRSTGLVTETLPGSLPDGEVTVMFKDHKYTPDKAEQDFERPAYTWHWDNIVVE